MVEGEMVKKNGTEYMFILQTIINYAKSNSLSKKKNEQILDTIEIGITPFLSNFLVSYLKGRQIISDILLMLEEEENMMVCN